MFLWNGYCPAHHRILAQDIMTMKKRLPKGEVMVHPECTADVIELSDQVRVPEDAWVSASKAIERMLSLD